MPAFQVERTFSILMKDLAPVARDVMAEFRQKGYEVKGEQTLMQGWRISLTKGTTFEAVLGMQTALNIEMTPVACGVHVVAGVGIFGQQAIPTVISVLVFWPVMIAQVWGLVQQSKLDDEAMLAVERSLNRHAAGSTTAPATLHCTMCGEPLPLQAKFCMLCGARVGRQPR